MRQTAVFPGRNLALGLALLAGLPASWSQTEAPPSELPAPPAHFSRDSLVYISIPGPGELRIGVDSETLSIGPDDVVRYVLVASTPRAMNVSYEGVDCKGGRMRVFARWNEGSGWKTLPDAPWKSLGDDRSTQLATALAKAGLCIGRSPNAPVSRMERELRTGKSDISNR
jgi:hypothetical protein